MKDKKKTIIILIIITIIVIATQIILNIFTPKNKVLISTYVKTLTPDDININIPCDKQILKENQIPYFRVSNTLYDSINKDILENSLLRVCYQNGYMSYDISLNDNILSLIVYISYETENELANIEYKTYNINTDTNQIVTNQELLNKYNLTVNQINTKVLTELNKYYNYEKENELVDQNITFSDYLNILEYKTVTLNNLSLFIDKKNDLYIYKDFSLSEGMKRVDYFPNLSNTFKLN